jgi:hypothetical protein
MTIDHTQGSVKAPSRGMPDLSGTLRRIADLEAVIERQSAARSNLSAQGLPTLEIDRIIDVLVGSLQLIRGYHAALVGEVSGGELLVSARSALPQA